MLKWAEYGGSGAAASLQAGGLFEAGLCLQGNLGLRAWRRAGMKGKRKFLQEGLKSCELGGWEWRWSYRDPALADVAFWLFQRSSVGYWSVALGWEFRGVWGVKVPVLSVWTCTWSCFSSGTGARGFLLLPAGARPSRTFATASQKPSDTAKSQRVGDQLSSPL